MNIQKAKGTYDILPNQVYYWQHLENLIRKICETYNYKEIRTPIFESTELFVRGVGESTDIVSKEMYTFDDKGGRSLTLRPEGTAPVVRSYVENKLYVDGQLTKLYYMGPMFRYERMQKGRYRQFYQFGVEVLGSESPIVDVEVIALSVQLIQALGLKEVKVAINTLGDQESRKAYREALINHFTPVQQELCSDCQKRLNQNPLRVLDCKVDRNHPSFAKAPKMSDYLSPSGKDHFDTVLNYLDLLKIDYVIDESLVRGLDYYNHTVFEIMSNVEGFGAQTALGGGGRYNGLVEEVGGPAVAGMGMAFGLDRLILALEAEKVAIANQNYLDAFIVTMSESQEALAMKLLQTLRQNGIKADKDFNNRKVKAQFKQADKLNAKFTVLLGETEVQQNRVVLKNMKTEVQTEVAIVQLVNELKLRLEE